MKRRSVLAHLGGSAALALPGCLGGDSGTKFKVANRLDSAISFTLTSGRVGDRDAECDDEAAMSQVADATLAAGRTESYETVTGTGLFRFRLGLDGGTDTGCAIREGKEKGFVFVVDDDVRFVVNDPGVGGPFG